MLINKDIPLHEDPILDCGAILLQLMAPSQQEHARNARRQFLLRDLAHKGRHVEETTLRSLAIKHLASDVNAALNTSRMHRTSVAVPDHCLVLVAKPNELRAARAVLFPDVGEPHIVEGYPTWEWSRDAKSRSIRFVLAMIGDAG